MSRSNRTYTGEFKKDAISLAMRSPSIKGVATDLGIPESTLTTWLKATTNKANKTKISEGINVSEELKMLRKENARLRAHRYPYFIDNRSQRECMIDLDVYGERLNKVFDFGL